MSADAASTGLDVARLVKEHQAGLWRYLRVLGCPPPLADDLTQETFLAVLQKPFHDHNKTATAAYLRQVARNLFITHQRRAALAPVVAGMDQYLDERDAAWSRWAAEDGGVELLSALQKCLQSLAERARRALGLRFEERQSRSNMAAALEMSEDGVKNLLQRTKQQLRDCIEKKLRQTDH